MRNNPNKAHTNFLLYADELGSIKLNSLNSKSVESLLNKIYITLDHGTVIDKLSIYDICCVESRPLNTEDLKKIADTLYQISLSI